MEKRMGTRVDGLVARLNKGSRKTIEFFGSLSDDQWNQLVYESPSRWTLRDLLAHFLSSEVGLLQIAQGIFVGDAGAPEGFDYNGFNAQEQVRLADQSPPALLSELSLAREATIAWLAKLDDADLDRMGRHPALGVISLETFITAIYGHQLMHMRDLARLSS
jgi:hypothetical protein